MQSINNNFTKDDLGNFSYDNNRESEVDRKPHLFISYNSKNKDFVQRLAKDLAVLEIDVWLDDWELRMGDSLFDKLSNALEISKYIAIIFSNEFTNSEWARSELKQAFSREIREKRTLIIPILIEETKIPPLIEDKIYLDLRKNYHEGLSRLAGMVHDLSIRGINEGIEKIKPDSVNDCIEVLRYVGFEPYIKVDAQIFTEILNAGGKLYKENRVRFDPDYILRSNKISKRTADYVKRAKSAWRKEKPISVSGLKKEKIKDSKFHIQFTESDKKENIDEIFHLESNPNKDALLKLIADNKMKQLFDELRKTIEVDSDIHSQIIVLQNQYSNLEKDKTLGILSTHEMEVRQNKITYSMVKIIEQI